MEYLIQAIETKKVARPDEKVARPDATPTSTKATLTPSKFKDQHIKNYQLHSNSTPALTDKKMIQAQKAKRALALTPLVAAASKPTELTAAGRIRVTTVRLSAYRYVFFLFSSINFFFSPSSSFPSQHPSQKHPAFQFMLTCANFLTRRVHSTRLSGGKSTCLTRKVSTVTMQSTFSFFCFFCNG